MKRKKIKKTAQNEYDYENESSKQKSQEEGEEEDDSCDNTEALTITCHCPRESDS
jgi:hypothetical protein